MFGRGFLASAVLVVMLGTAPAVSGAALGHRGAVPAALTWKVDASPSPPGKDAQLSGVTCAVATACFAVGASYSSGGAASRRLLERWDGHSWSIVVTPNPAGALNTSFADIACPAVNSCFAVGSSDGHTLVEYWNGHTWSVQPSFNPPGRTAYLSGVACPSTTNCLAVGTSGSNTDERRLLERWNGQHWSSAVTPGPSGDTGFADVSCAGANSCTIVGISGVYTSSQPLAEHWDGHQWVAQHPGSPFGVAELVSVSCATATSCVAVGDVYAGADIVPRTRLVTRWNGTSWHTDTTPLPHDAVRGANEDNSFLGVACNSAAACVAVGNYTTSLGINTLAERWDGHTWSIEPTLNPGGAAAGPMLNGVECTTPRSCIAVGGVIPAANSKTLIERSH